MITIFRMVLRKICAYTNWAGNIIAQRCRKRPTGQTAKTLYLRPAFCLHRISAGPPRRPPGRRRRHRLAVVLPGAQDRKHYAVQSNHRLLAQLQRETGQEHFVCCPMRTISLNLCCLLHEHATFFAG